MRFSKNSNHSLKVRFLDNKIDFHVVNGREGQSDAVLWQEHTLSMTLLTDTVSLQSFRKNQVIGLLYFLYHDG